MDAIVDIFVSWQFLLVAGIIFIVFGFFNGLKGWKGVGYYLWRLGGKKNMRWLRSFLKFMEVVKVPLLALMGFGIGWIPNMPRPEPLAESSTLTVALLYTVAGICSMFLVKAIKRALEARGIDVDLDVQPRDQISNKKKPA